MIGYGHAGSHVVVATAEQNSFTRFPASTVLGTYDFRLGSSRSQNQCRSADIELCHRISLPLKPRIRDQLCQDLAPVSGVRRSEDR